MAAKKKQKKMVLHDKGVATPSVCFGVQRPGKRQKEGRLAEGIPVTNKDTGMMARSSVFSAKDLFKVSAMIPVEHLPNSTIHPDLSPDNICKGIKVTLDNNKLWNEFFRCQTEMIVTTQGSRMFPYCRFRISGLEPTKKYSLMVDIQPMDNYSYKWTGHNWQLAGKSERHVKSRPFSHPDSPSTGQYWMQNPVSFYRLKLTNNITEQEGNVVLHALHRYLPRLHIVPFDKATAHARLSGPNIVTVSFPQTEFFAVTAFQNSRFAQLKVDCNPFAKGLKEDGFCSLALKLKSNPSKDSNKHQETESHEHPMKKNLKSLLENHKIKNYKLFDQKHSDKDAVKSAPTLRDQSSAMGAEKKSCNTCPKLFSELIREAHISLKRCNLEHVGMSNSTVCKGEATGVTDSRIKWKRKALSKDGLSSKTQSPSTRTGKTSATKNNFMGSVKEDNHFSGSVNKTLAAVTDSKISPSSSVDSDSKSEADTRPEENGKPYKRPAPVPLPALARFLKQHRVKPKNARTSPEPPKVSPSHSTQAPTCLATSNSPEPTVSNLDISKDVQTAKDGADFPGQTAISIRNDWKPSSDSPVSSPHPEMLDAAPELPGSGKGAYTSRLSTSPTLSQTYPLSDSTGVATHPSKPAMVLKPESSPFGFESLSCDDSPEPLPGLSAELEHSPAALQPVSKLVSQQQMSYSANSAAVLKWPSVLPLPDPFLSAFPYQQTPAPQFASSVQGSLQPSIPLSLSHTVSHDQGHSSSPPPDPVPSFQDSDQSLPFPGELSPLALQLSMSPTFSSLDGGGLSPTPSLTDLIRIIGNDDDNLEIEEAFPNTEVALDLCPPPCTSPTQPAQPPANIKTQMAKKKSRTSRAARMDQAENDSDASYASTKPSLEEVEQQLFVSFISKEALRLHIVEPSENQRVSPAHLPIEQPRQMPEENQNAETTGSLEDKISTLETLLLRDLKLMKHRQVIHPVLQEVGLKLSLLDPTLEIDLQYLGVRLPLPPPGLCLPLSEDATSTQTVSAAFVSRTGKTTDVTRIKGWRDKYAQSEPSSSPSAAKPEVLPMDSASDVPTKNLSAFCSDMLDEYLENEAKLIDERAASFSQAPFEAVTYELPSVSSSYIRTLDSLKKQPLAIPTSSLISSFVPPSKRPRMPSMGPKKVKAERKRKSVGPKPNKPGDSPVMDFVSAVGAPALSNTTQTPPSADSKPNSEIPNEDTPKKKKKKLKLQMLLDQSDVPLDQSDTEVKTHPPNETLKKKHKSEMPLAHSEAVFNSLPSNNDAFKKNQKSVLQTHPLNVHTVKKRKKLKYKASEQTTRPTLTNAVPPGILQDMAPLESDSELLNADEPTAKPLVTKALLKLKDLEDGVLWEGKPQTCITEERAAIALTSLFTLVGFAREDPTAPIQLIKRRAPPCLNDFCRLGCVCACLLRSRRLTHCGKAACMFGCSCLRQKVVLLKHLDTLDADTGGQGKKRKKRMKMAYVLKDAEPIAQPSQSLELFRTLWRKDLVDEDPEPIHIPQSVLSVATATAVPDVSCARVRGFQGRKTLIHSSTPTKVSTSQSTDNQSQSTDTPAPVQKAKKPKKARPSNVKPPTGGAAKQIQPVPGSGPSPPEHGPPPSKRLTIMAECRWSGTEDQNLVLREVCRAMALSCLAKPFMVREYLVTPISQFKDQNNCLNYKVRISQGPARPEQSLQETQRGDPSHNHQGPERREKGEEALPEMEDWQKEVEEEDFQEEEEVERGGGEVEDRGEKEERSPEAGEEETGQTSMKTLMKMGLPFLTGISPAGVLQASRKEPGTCLPVQVNGKSYPLAKVQLGGMGALHPANRLAAFLTGRVAQYRKQLASPSPASTPPCRTPPAAPANAVTAITAITAGPRAKGPEIKIVKIFPNGGSPVNPSTVAMASATPQLLVVHSPATVGQQMAKSSLTAVGQQVAKSSLATVGQPLAKSCLATVVQQVAKSSLATVGQPLAKSSLTAVGQQVAKSSLTAVGQPLAKSSLTAVVQQVAKSSLTAVGQQVVREGQSTLSAVSQQGRTLLAPCRPVSGKMYMKMADGKLVQLVPLSQLRAANPGLVLQTNNSSPFPGIQTFQPISTAMKPNFLSRKDTCHLQIVPHGNKQPITVVCPKVPSNPRVFTLLQPPSSVVQWAEPEGAQSDSAPAKPPETSVEDQKEASPVQIVDEALSSLASKRQEEEEDADSAETELSDDPLSQPPETTAVEDQKEASYGWCVGRGQEEDSDDYDSTEEEHSSSSEADDSDCRLTKHTENESRKNSMEKTRRDELKKKFDRLREELHLLPKTPKIAILRQAQQVAEALRRTRMRQERRRMMLEKERRQLLATMSQLTPPSTQAPPALSGAPATQAPPALSEASATQEPPALSGAPATQAPHALSEAPATQEPPALSGAPATQAPPTLSEAPATQEPPALSGAPATQAPPALSGAPATQEPHALSGAPAHDGGVDVIDLLDDEPDIITITTDEEVEDLTVEDLTVVDLTVEDLTVVDLTVEGSERRRCSSNTQGASSREDEDVRVEEGFRSLRTVLHAHDEARLLLLQLARRGISELREQSDELERERTKQWLQRDAYIREISQRSGKSTDVILTKVEALSAKQREVEESHKRSASIFWPPAGAYTTISTSVPTPGSATTTTTSSWSPGKSTDVILTKVEALSAKQREVEESHKRSASIFWPPAGAYTTISTSVPTPGSATTTTTSSWSPGGYTPPTMIDVATPPPPQRAALALSPPPAHPDAPWARPRTRPNILCHRKSHSAGPMPLAHQVVNEGTDQCATMSSQGPPAQPALLTLVTPPLAGSGSPLLMLSSLAAAPALQAPPTPGMTSVFLNLTNQQRLSVPGPPTVQLFSTALLATPTANVTAGGCPTLLLTAPPGGEEEQSSDPTLIATAPPGGVEEQSSDPTLIVTAPPGGEQQQSSDAALIVTAPPGGEQQQSSDATFIVTAPPGGEQQQSSDATFIVTTPPGGEQQQSSDPTLIVTAPPAGEEEKQQQEESNDPTQREEQEEESLKSLLSEIVFLSQRSSHRDQEGAPPGGGGGPGDSTESRAPGSAPQCTAAVEVLAPPPLTQMANERTGDVEGGVAWRPMPRLVPLGLKPLPNAT